MLTRALLMRVIAVVFAVGVLAVPLHAEAIVGELIGEEVCVNLRLPVPGDEPGDGRCVPLGIPALPPLPF